MIKCMEWDSEFDVEDALSCKIEVPRNTYNLSSIISELKAKVQAK